MMPGVGSMIAGLFGKVLGHTEQVSQNGTDNTFVVHIWGLTNQILALSSGTMSCFGCSLSATQGLSYNAGIGGNEKPSSGKCGGSSVAEGKAIGQIAKLAALVPYMPIPEYFSELDSLNWRTGCRDFSIMKILKSNAFTCSAESGTKGIGGLSKKNPRHYRQGCLHRRLGTIVPETNAGHWTKQRDCFRHRSLSRHE